MASTLVVAALSLFGASLAFDSGVATVPSEWKAAYLWSAAGLLLPSCALAIYAGAKWNGSSAKRAGRVGVYACILTGVTVIAITLLSAYDVILPPAYTHQPYAWFCWVPAGVSFLLGRSSLDRRFRRGKQARMFIASAEAHLPIARAIEDLIGDRLDVRVWRDVFNEGAAINVEVVMHEAKTCDYGLFLFAPDDQVSVRSRAGRGAPHAPVHLTRDNVLFELGLFAAQVGLHRALVMEPREGMVARPTDLDGLTTIAYPYEDAKAATGQQLSAVLQGCVDDLLTRITTLERDKYPN